MASVMPRGFPLVIFLVIGFVSPCFAEWPGTVQPKESEMASRSGWYLLRDQRWEEAAEYYGAGAGDLERESYWAARPLENEPPAALIRRRALLWEFYLKSVDFTQLSDATPTPILRLLEYRDLVATLPDDFPKIDCARIDALQAIYTKGRHGAITVAERDLALAAVQEHPTSMPAFAGLLIVLTAQPNGAGLLTWSEAEELATHDWAQLALARAAVTAYSVPLDARERVIQAGLPYAPSREERALLLFRLASHQRGDQSQISAELADRVVATCRQAFEQFPMTSFAAHCRHLAVETEARSGRIEPAFALLRELQDDPQQQEGLDRALLALSTSCFAAKQYDRSESLLNEVLEKYPTTTTASRAMLGLADVFAARRDRQNERIWLIKCAEFKLTEETHLHLMDSGDTRSVAVQRLAESYQRDGNWAEALTWWLRWEPQSWCGTCGMQMQASRIYHAALCQVHLNQHAEVAKTCFDAIENKTAEWSPEPTFLLFELYREAGQVNDLVRLVGANRPQDDYSWEQSPAGLVHRWNEVYQLEQRHEFSQLIKICEQSINYAPHCFSQPSRDNEIECKFAAEALARAGEDAVQAIRLQLSEQENSNLTGWLLYALGRSDSPAAIHALQELIDKKTPCSPVDLATALWLQGESGRPWLEQLIQQANPHIVRLVRERLDVLEAERAYFKPWPKTPSDALPRAGASPAMVGTIGFIAVALLTLVTSSVVRRWRKRCKSS